MSQPAYLECIHISDPDKPRSPKRCGHKHKGLKAAKKCARSHGCDLFHPGEVHVRRVGSEEVLVRFVGQPAREDHQPAATVGGGIIMTPDRAREIAAERRGSFDYKSPQWWLEDPETGEDAGEDYCHECAETVVLLPGLVVCYVLRLLGVDVSTPQPHEWQKRGDERYHWQSCKHCDETLYHDRPDAPLDPCRSWPERIIALADEAVHCAGVMEADGWRCCENCGADLRVSFTDYAVESELEHWQEHGPPDSPREWWEVSEVLESMWSQSKHWPQVFALLAKWGLGAEQEGASA